MLVCPKCNAAYANDTKVEYCICGHKFVPNLLREIFAEPNDIMSEFFKGK